MAEIAYDLNNAEVHQGPGDIWIIDPAPTDVAERLTLGANGRPDNADHASSVHLGAIASAITFQLTPQVANIELDQYESPIAQYVDKLNVSIEAELAQTEMVKISKALGVGTYSSPSGAKQITFGGNTAVTEFCVAAISKKRTDPTKFIVACLYKTIASGGVKIMLSRKSPSFYTVKFTGLQDLTRTAGKQIGIVYETV